MTMNEEDKASMIMKSFVDLLNREQVEPKYLFGEMVDFLARNMHKTIENGTSKLAEAVIAYHQALTEDSESKVKVKFEDHDGININLSKANPEDKSKSEMLREIFKDTCVERN